MVLHDLLFTQFISYANKKTEQQLLNKYSFYLQGYAGKCLTTGSPGKAESSVGCFCQFPSLWCKFSHRGQFKLPGMTSLDMTLGRDVHNPFPSPVSQLWHTTAPPFY